MSKKVDILITKNGLKNIKKGSTIRVSRGYAFNYLIPKQIGEIATQGKLKHINMFNNIIKQRQETRNITENLIRKKLDKIKKVSIYKKTGDNQLIFGSITEKDIHKWLQHHSNLDKEKIKFEVTEIKQLCIESMKLNYQLSVKMIKRLYVLPINI